MSLFRKRLLIWTMVLMVLFTITGQAQQLPSHTLKTDDANGVKIADLVEIAIEVNPEVAALRSEFDAARARIPQAKALPDPVLIFGNINVGSPVPFLKKTDDFNENFNLGFSQEFPWFGIRRMRGLVASAESEAKFQEYQIARRRLTAEVKTNAYEIYFIDRALAIIKRDLDIMDKFAKVAEARYSVGKAQQVDLINAQLEITELLDKEGNLEAKRAMTAAKLNQLLLREPEAPIGMIAGVQLSPEPPALDKLIELAEANAPDLAQHRRHIDASSHALRLAEREAKYPEVGVQFVYHNRTPAFPAFYSYQLNLRLPLYAFNKQRYAIEEQSANLAAARLRLTATDSLIRYKLRDACVRVTTMTRLIKLHEQGLIPQSALALESSISAYQVGQVDFLTLLTALRRALDYETHYYEMVTDYQKALAEMESYIGVELTR